MAALARLSWRGCWPPSWGRAGKQQVRHLNRACGLVGYPNVGKSTLFNAFVGSNVAAAENFPFCTVEPNVVKIGVPDPRLDALAATCGAAKVVPGLLEIRDIAGLIKGASSGAGMGNAFLSQIRGVQVVFHVVRCFSDAKIVHVEDPVNIDPVKEYESILEELTIADLELAARRLPVLRKKATTTKEVERLLPVYEAVLLALEAGRPARAGLAAFPDAHAAGDEFLSQLITAKPVVVLANVSPEDAARGNAYAERLMAHVAASEAAAAKEAAARTAAASGSRQTAGGGAVAAAAEAASAAARRCVVISAPLEAEVAQLDDQDFRKEYLESYGLKEDDRALPKILAESQSLLRLVSYLTVGEAEARAWFVPKGSRAHEAAGAIHSDFVRNFEQAEVWSTEDILRLGGKSACRRAGLVRQRGKDYEVQDGDVIEFRIRGGRS